MPDFSHKLNALEFGDVDQRNIQKIKKDFNKNSHENHIHDSKDNL